MSQTLLNNRYQIISSLARGGFGETFLATDTHLPSAKKCVIKQLKPLVQVQQLPSWLKERFQKEAAVLEELGNHHSQIPKLYAYFSEGENFYLVQEWIEGMTLTQKRQQKNNFTESEVKELLVNLLPVLDYIHSRGIIHRDIKPDNIIIRESDGQAILIDFGIIKETIGTQYNGQTVSSVILGTPGYMASEQAAGRPVYSSDLYSLGLTAVFLLSGKSPQDFALDPRTGEIIWRSILNDAHSDLIMVLEKVIRFHPRDRFYSAQEMLAALKNVSTQEATNRTTKVITPTTNTQIVKGAEAGGLKIWLWVWMLVVSFAAFVLGFTVVRLQSRFGNNPNPNVLPSSVDFPDRPLPTPSIEVTPTPIETPRRRRRNIPSFTPTPTPTPTPEILITPTPIPTPEVLITPTPIPTPSETVIPVIPSPETPPTPEIFPSPLPTVEPPQESPSL